MLTIGSFFARRFSQNGHDMDEWLIGWYNITPFTGSNQQKQPSFSDPFYETSRYRNFTELLSEAADLHGVKLRKVTKTIGLWQGNHEPSVSVKIEGKRRDIEKVAELLLQEFSQKSVSIVYQPGSSEHLTYRFMVPETSHPAAVLHSLITSGVTGAHLTPKEVRLNELSELELKVLDALTCLYGTIHINKCEVVRILA